ADLTGGEQLAQGDHVRQEPGPHRLHREQPTLGGSIEQLPGLRGVTGEGLLHQHRLARLQGEQRVLQVLRVRGSDVDRLDLRIGDELRIARMRRRDVVLRRERLGAPAAAGADRDHGGGGVRWDVPGEPAGDAARAEDAPAQRRSGGRVRSEGSVMARHGTTIEARPRPPAPCLSGSAPPGCRVCPQPPGSRAADSGTLVGMVEPSRPASKVGLYSIPELEARGVDRRRRARLVRQGRLIPAARGWFATGEADPSALSALRSGVRLTCVSAARLHGLWTPKTPGTHAYGRRGSVPSGFVRHGPYLDRWPEP